MDKTQPHAIASLCPDEEHQTTSLQWRVCGASVRGTSHERLELPGQDACLWRAFFPTQTLYVVLADGAGSASLSHRGSLCATQRALESLTSTRETEWGFAPEEDVRTRLMAAVLCAQRAVTEEATRQNVSERELATTLLVAVATPSFVALAQVGDGGLVVRATSGEYTLLVRPYSGEYANQTDFLTSANALEQAQFRVWHGEVESIVAFTDGLQRVALVYPEGVPYAPFFDPLVLFTGELTTEDEEPEANARLTQFLQSPALRERADDDLTLVAARLNPCNSLTEASASGGTYETDTNHEPVASPQ